MAEMTAVEYLKTKQRMTKNCSLCNNCKLSYCNNGKDIPCGDFEMCHSEEAISIVQKWAEEHPVKTFLFDLLEKHPNVVLDCRGVPKYNCPYYLGYEKKNSCPNNDSDCVKCWNRPLEE